MSTMFPRQNRHGFGGPAATLGRVTDYCAAPGLMLHGPRAAIKSRARE